MNNAYDLVNSLWLVGLIFMGVASLSLLVHIRHSQTRIKQSQSFIRDAAPSRFDNDTDLGHIIENSSSLDPISQDAMRLIEARHVKLKKRLSELEMDESEIEAPNPQKP